MEYEYGRSLKKRGSRSRLSQIYSTKGSQSSISAHRADCDLRKQKDIHVGLRSNFPEAMAIKCYAYRESEIPGHVHQFWEFGLWSKHVQYADQNITSRWFGIGPA
ncbi:uncharacterized protein PV06_03353 [Exophiala oligosperma]|uniref:Uncharacterized protein n=1 Tax=Exophiala oligosperma TaxID=215243 RepID=A0A0D2C552_9EURO|nr:uncharacterized protein PV06_03353 [Exophiala oligosperma]KIW44917.1 hypothetical protein PV06_03353 [Exophiala oligosperma]